MKRKREELVVMEEDPALGPYRPLGQEEKLPKGVKPDDVVIFQVGEHAGQRGIPIRAEKRAAQTG